MSVGAVTASLPEVHDRVKVKDHIPSLDGLRAVAVMIVFVAHAGFDRIVPGGFGVTIFFFLSGYLITTLIRKEWESTGCLNLKAFYLRRMLRIWPPMYITIGMLSAAGYLGLEHMEVPEAGPLLAQLFHYANYYQIWGSGHAMPGTGIFWSLAVEEHFYVVWPACFIILAKRLSFGQIAAVLAVGCALVLAWRFWLVLGWNVAEWRTYAGTDTRIDSIMYGCLLALWMNPRYTKQKGRSTAVPVMTLGSACVLLLATFLIRNTAFRETIRYSIQGIALMPVFYWAVLRSDFPLFRPLNWRPIRFVGDISYSIYLSHFILLAFFASMGLGWLAVIGLGALTTFLFAVSMNLVIERPLGRIRHRLAQAKANAPEYVPT